MVTRGLRAALLAALACSLVACVQDQIESERALPELDSAYFRCAVEPMLVKRCAFAACHGTYERPFRVYAPRRFRAGGSAGATLSEDEHVANYDNARAMAGDAATPRLLELKPLAAGAGGYFHRGQSLYGGGDVFDSVDDPSYQVIATWIDGASAEASCSPAAEVGP